MTTNMNNTSTAHKKNKGKMTFSNFAFLAPATPIINSSSSSSSSSSFLSNNFQLNYHSTFRRKIFRPFHGNKTHHFNPTVYVNRRRTATMQLPPMPKYDIPISDEFKGPPGYKWNDEYPGTMKPGTVEDNYPLEQVMKSGVYERMVYDEFDMDERVADIFEPDEDLLEWLDKNGRLIGRDAQTDDYDFESETHMSTISEDDLDYADDDSKMIAYYSRQSEGNSLGSSFDFGGFSESTDYEAGF